MARVAITSHSRNYVRISPFAESFNKQQVTIEQKATGKRSPLQILKQDFHWLSANDFKITDTREIIRSINSSKLAEMVGKNQWETTALAEGEQCCGIQ